MSYKVKLIIMNFLQFAVWGAYLTSQGRYLSSIGLDSQIGYFYTIQGIVSIFMPALIGIIADKWIPAQRTLGICQLLAGVFMLATGFYGFFMGTQVSFGTLFLLYTISVVFFMPTIALSYTVAYSIIRDNGGDTIKDFPPIRVWGTVGFIFSMWFVDIMSVGGVSFQSSSLQYVFSGLLGLTLAVYAFFLPNCKCEGKGKSKSLADALGLKAFALFKQKRMAIFFIFSMLLGVCLQITNSFANPFLGDFGNLPQYADSLVVKHSNVLISLSQVSETLCILLIPFFMKKYGIKKVMLIAMFAWVLRFAFFVVGNPGSGLPFLFLSMIVYGIAFDFFNISGSLFVEKSTDSSIRGSAQGLFALMTNGIGAAVGTYAAQAIINKLVNSHRNAIPALTDWNSVMNGWSHSWCIFAIYALIVAVMFAILFKYKHTPEQEKK